MEKRIIKKNSVISTNEWILTKIIMLIPLVNIVMLLYWSFNDSTNLNKSNWAKASIIVWIIGFIFYFIIFFISITFFLNLFDKLFMLHV